MSEILDVVKGLNEQVMKLNNERNRQLGMLESAKAQYLSALEAYKTKYGIELTEANLQSEYNKVYAETKGKVLDLQEEIASIKRGDYVNTDKVVDIDTEPNVEPIRAPKSSKKAEEEKKEEGNTSKGDRPSGIIDYAALTEGAQNQPKPHVINLAEDIEDEEDVEESTPTFGGSPINFGGTLESTPAPEKREEKKEEKKEEKRDMGITFGSDVEDDAEDTFSPDGWGTASDEINQNFKDILDGGIKFGE